jgi:hypothetical protein
MSRFEKIMFPVLYVLFGTALGLSMFQGDYDKGIWIITALIWMYAAHRLRRNA